ncbi:hypothetical protein MUK42_04649 [Musa troglodytarum]|uniref:Uncharacterized protein n=1 Tax=Musa troglodytarum TaxID=320322 RepID=A0A9E7GGW7_9LILI|nr:hypothetical protein MUK42_04649 [Musa troglodytarum]
MKGSRKKGSHLMPVVEESVGPGDEDGPPGAHRIIVAAEMQACGAIGRQPNRVRSGVDEQQQRQEEDGGEEGAGGGAAHRDVSCRVRSGAARFLEHGPRRPAATCFKGCAVPDGLIVAFVAGPTKKKRPRDVVDPRSKERLDRNVSCNNHFTFAYSTLKDTTNACISPTGGIDKTG